MAMSKKSTKPSRDSHPSPVDIHVGSKVRLRRTLLGLSQERLGDALGLSFQQVQKYERGLNRIGASRLFDISRMLEAPISYFFEDIPEGLSETPVAGPRGRTYQPAETLSNRRFDNQNDELKNLLWHCLLVEDDLLLAADAEDMLRQAGAGDVKIARSVAEALEMVTSQNFSFALLDVNLGTETSLPIARVLSAANIPMAFVTGYSEVVISVEPLRDVPIISKPYFQDSMRKTLLQLAQVVSNATVPDAQRPPAPPQNEALG